MKGHTNIFQGFLQLQAPSCFSIAFNFPLQNSLNVKQKWNKGFGCAQMQGIISFRKEIRPFGILIIAAFILILQEMHLLTFSHFGFHKSFYFSNKSLKLLIHPSSSTNLWRFRVMHELTLSIQCQIFFQQAIQFNNFFLI